MVRKLMTTALILTPWPVSDRLRQPEHRHLGQPLERHQHRLPGLGRHPGQPVQRPLEDSTGAYSADADGAVKGYDTQSADGKRTDADSGLSDAAKDAGDAAKDTAKDAGDAVKDLGNAAKNAAQGVGDAAEDALDDVTGTAKGR